MSECEGEIMSLGTFINVIYWIGFVFCIVIILILGLFFVWLVARFIKWLMDK